MNERPLTSQSQWMRFHGRVTGVGFRYAAERLAKKLNLSGWVRNADVGVVEAEVHGSSLAVQQFKEGLCSMFHVEHLDVVPLDLPTLGFTTSDFRIIR